MPDIAESQLDRINTLKDSLASDGIWSMQSMALEKHWEAPAMPSKWRLEREPDKETQKLEEAARNLGRMLANGLDGVAPELSQLSPGPQLEELTRKKWHARIANGLVTDNTGPARALYTFRKKIGFFPKEPEKTQVSDEAMKDILRERKEHAKEGIETKPFESFYSSPQQAAFAQAWQKQTPKRDGQSIGEWNRELNSYAPAWDAYSRIKRGIFVDHNTLAAKN